MTNGTRLPDDWELPEDYRTFALTLGLDSATIAWEADKFLDYWISLSGAKATKRNWFATWRNWCRRVIEFKGTAAKPKPKQTWQLSDDELLALAHKRGVTSAGLNRKQLEGAVERKQ